MQNLLESFVQWVQQRKTVELEELAAEFDMRVQASAESRLPAMQCRPHS